MTTTTTRKRRTKTIDEGGGGRAIAILGLVPIRVRGHDQGTIDALTARGAGHVPPNVNGIGVTVIGQNAIGSRTMTQGGAGVAIHILGQGRGVPLPVHEEIWRLKMVTATLDVRVEALAKV